MPPLRPPKLNDEQLLTAIALAPEDTVRAVLRALTGDDAFKSRIAALMAKLPLGLATTAAGSSGKSDDPSKKRKAPPTHICVQCDELFEEGDTSKTCKYHPYDMELDYSAPAWVDWPYPDGIHDSEHMRKAYPNGFTFPCCEALGTEANEGCKLGKHRAADGKRSKYPGSDGETASEDEETEEEFDESEEDWDDDEDVDEDEEDDQDDQDGAGQDKVKKDGDQEE